MCISLCIFAMYCVVHGDDEGSEVMYCVVHAGDEGGEVMYWVVRGGDEGVGEDGVHFPISWQFCNLHCLPTTRLVSITEQKLESYLSGTPALVQVISALI